MAIESWKKIPGFGGVYEASSLGRIRSAKRIVPCILRAHVNGDGYAKVILFDGSRGSGKKPTGRCVSVHRAVWEAFCGPVPAEMQVDHIDSVSTNNSLENLQLLTPLANKRKAWARVRAGQCKRILKGCPA